MASPQPRAAAWETMQQRIDEVQADRAELRRLRRMLAHLVEDTISSHAAYVHDMVSRGEAKARRKLLTRFSEGPRVKAQAQQPQEERLYGQARAADTSSPWSVSAPSGPSRSVSPRPLQAAPDPGLSRVRRSQSSSPRGAPYAAVAPSAPSFGFCGSKLEPSGSLAYQGACSPPSARCSPPQLEEPRAPAAAPRPASPHTTDRATHFPEVSPRAAAARQLVEPHELECAAPPAPAPASAAPSGPAAAEAQVAAGGPVVVLMRHGVRADSDGQRDAPTQWADEATRRHDPPLAAGSEGIVRDAAQRMLDCGLRPDQVVSSPYRRCIQTACLVAAQLGIATVYISPGLQEFVNMARRLVPAERPLDFLSTDAMQQLARETCSGVAVCVHPKGIPPNSDAAEDINRRVGIVVPFLADRFAKGGGAVLVTHGDLVNTYLPELDPGVGRYKADEGGWAALRPPVGQLWPDRVPDNSWIICVHRLETM